MEYTASRHSTAQPLGNSPAQQSIVSIGHSTVQLSAWDAVQHSSDAQHRTVQYCTVLCNIRFAHRAGVGYNTAQCNVAQSSAVLYNTLQHNTAHECTIQYGTVLYSTVLCCAVLYCAVLRCTALRHAQHSAAQRCALPFLLFVSCEMSFLPREAIQYCTVLCCAALYCAVLYCNNILLETRNKQNAVL